MFGFCYFSLGCRLHMLPMIQMLTARQNTLSPGSVSAAREQNTAPKPVMASRLHRMTPASAAHRWKL